MVTYLPRSITLLSNNSSKYRPTLNTALVRKLYGAPYDLPKIESGDWMTILFKISHQNTTCGNKMDGLANYKIP